MLPQLRNLSSFCSRTGRNLEMDLLKKSGLELLKKSGINLREKSRMELLKKSEWAY